MSSPLEEPEYRNDKKLGGPNGRPAEAYLMLKLLFATGAPLKYTVTE